MSKDGRSKLERFLGTLAGARFLEEAERDAAEKEAAVQARRDLAAQRAEFLRRRKEVLPAMRRVVEATDRDLAEVRAALRAAQARRADAGRAAFSEDSAIHEGVRRVEIALTRSADPRILAGIEEADEALRGWSERQGALYRYRSEKDSSWDGVTTWVKRWGNNQAGVDALKKGIEDARKALERLALVAEPAEEAIAEGIATVKAAIAACHGDPPPLDMQEFDHNGNAIGRPAPMPLAK